MILVNKKKKEDEAPLRLDMTPSDARLRRRLRVYCDLCHRCSERGAGCYTMKAITVCLLNTDDSRKGSVTATGVGKCGTKSLFTSGDTSVKIYCSLKSVSQMIVRRTMNLFLELLIYLLVILWSYLLKYLIFYFFYL